MLPVVVCGAGPVGLVLALELAAWQVPVLSIERHRSPSPSPAGVRSAPVHRYPPGGPVGEIYGIGDRGAVLVRPDGHVAWRASALSSAQ